VQLTGDAGPLGLGTDRADPAEPAGVVDRECEQAREAVEEVGVFGPVGVGGDVFERDQADQ
jgi:hypothetical protein